MLVPDIIYIYTASNELDRMMITIFLIYKINQLFVLFCFVCRLIIIMIRINYDETWWTMMMMLNKQWMNDDRSPFWFMFREKKYWPNFFSLIRYNWWWLCWFYWSATIKRVDYNLPFCCCLFHFFFLFKVRYGYLTWIESILIFNV